MDKATSTSVQTIAFNVQISAAGFASENLAAVTVRYWFTADGNTLPNLTFTSYGAQGYNGVDISKSLNHAFVAAPPANVTATSDTYLELSFGAAAGMLPPLSGGAIIQVSFHGPYYPSVPFNEINDYSFDPTKTTYQLSTRITAYLNGQLAWGCEPQASAASSSGGAVGSSGAGADSGSAGSSGGEGGGGGG